MRFEEAYYGWQERRLTQEEAATLPGVCGWEVCQYRYCALNKFIHYVISIISTHCQKNITIGHDRISILLRGDFLSSFEQFNDDRSYFLRFYLH